MPTVAAEEKTHNGHIAEGRRQSRRSTVGPTNVIGDSTSQLAQTILRLTGGTPEILYNTNYNWPPHKIIRYLIDNSFSVPGSGSSSRTGLVTITSRHGVETSIPAKYRIPLMFVAQFLWTSLQINLPPNADTWDEWKYDILHVSILCSTFLAFAREESERGKMHKAWRWPVFDRPLIRFYHGWLLVRPDGIDGDGGVLEFEEEFGLQIYAPDKDILAENWTKVVLKGHKGFQLTRHQLQNGVSASEFYRGLRVVDGEPPSWPEVREDHIQVSAPEPEEDQGDAQDVDHKMDVDVESRSTMAAQTVSTPAPQGIEDAMISEVEDSPPSQEEVARAEVSRIDHISDKNTLPASPVDQALTNGPSSAGPSTTIPQLSHCSFQSSKEGISSLLTHIFSSEPSENAIPKAVNLLVAVIDSERREYDDRLTQYIQSQERTAQAQAEQFKLEMSAREQEWVEHVKMDAAKREKRIIAEFRRLFEDNIHNR